MATEQKQKPKNGRRTRSKKVDPELVFEDGHYWIVSGTKRLDVGINKQYAQKMLAEQLETQ